jgi:hypothetical protein
MNTLPPPLHLQESPVRLEGLPLISSTLLLEVAVEVAVEVGVSRAGEGEQLL